MYEHSLLTEGAFLLFHIKEYRQKCQDLEYEKKTAQKQIESLESQKKSLSEKYELVQVNLNAFMQFRSHVEISGGESFTRWLIGHECKQVKVCKDKPMCALTLAPSYPAPSCPCVLLPLHPSALAPYHPCFLLHLYPLTLAPSCPCALPHLCPLTLHPPGLLPSCPCAILPLHPPALAPYHPCSLLPLYPLTLAPSCPIALAPLALAPSCLSPLCPFALAASHPGALPPLCLCTLVLWHPFVFSPWNIFTYNFLKNGLIFNPPGLMPGSMPPELSQSPLGFLVQLNWGEWDNSNGPSRLKIRPLLRKLWAKTFLNAWGHKSLWVQGAQGYVLCEDTGFERTV